MKRKLPTWASTHGMAVSGVEVSLPFSVLIITGTGSLPKSESDGHPRERGDSRDVRGTVNDMHAHPVLTRQRRHE